MLDPVRPSSGEADDLKPADIAHQPLWGIPVAVKDVFCTRDMPTTCASRMLEHFIPPYDAFVVERLRKAGAIIVAKTNMDEFAMGSSSEQSAFGPTSNPWNIRAVAGGSSGGSAAAVTAMQVYGALGSDTGGSIRQPAALCGCVGLKPTYGRISRYGGIAYASSFDQPGPMARTVEDCALLFSVIGGYDARDAMSAALPMPDVAEGFRRGDLAGVTLGLPKEYWDEGLSPEVANACRNAVRIARDRGAAIVDISLPNLRYSVAAYYILASAEAASNLARFDGIRYGLREGEEQGLLNMYTASRSQGFGEEVKRRILLGTYALSAGYYDAYYKKASQARRLILNDFETALGSCDALLAPVTPVAAWTKGSFSNDPLTAYKMDILTISLNLAGLPGLALPVGLGETSRMPVGVQLMGRPFDEAGLLSIGRALEDALPACGSPTMEPLL
jgi:aspartyl-tRNA(Asn)/glutamyl-tRNA(Gln) amidotransferase subunit A